jgi:hypothetical protein
VAIGIDLLGLRCGAGEREAGEEEGELPCRQNEKKDEEEEKGGASDVKTVKTN